MQAGLSVAPCAPSPASAVRTDPPGANLRLPTPTRRRRTGQTLGELFNVGEQIGIDPYDLVEMPADQRIAPARYSWRERDDHRGATEEDRT
jgi:hypothetical protein